MNEQYMKKLARLLVRKGADVQPGQLVVVNAELEHGPIVREIVQEAWRAGAKDVWVSWNDDVLSREFYLNASPEVIETIPAWKALQIEDAAKEGASFIRLDGEDPDGLSAVDPKRLMNRKTALRKATPIYRKGIDAGNLAWTIGAAPTKAWAKKMYPELSEDEAVDQLWEAIFAASRIDENDPEENWEKHDATFSKRMEILNQADLKALHYTSSNGTDLTVELPEGYLFAGGSFTMKDGRKIFCNIPTEEIFSAPKKTGVNGQLEAVMPLSVNGSLVDGFGFTFKDGKVVDFHADQGKEVLESLMETDEGSRYLGEVALVDKSSPIRTMGRIFYSTLFDENAACHFALGQSYGETIENGLDMTEEELEEKGMNQSLIHVDFMVGADDLNIDGIRKDGSILPVFRGGTFVI